MTPFFRACSLSRRNLLRRMCAGAGLLCLLALSGFPTPASAQGLADLRQQGVVGERYDGYVAVRTAGAAAAATVAEVNAQRRQIYEVRARQQNVPVDQVGRVYAKQLLGELPAGTWFQNEQSVWVQKK
jgi:uncharacterized protein YdbL (DUF1318 family)